MNGSTPPIQPPAGKPGAGLFWLALFAPAVLVLISVLCTSRRDDTFGVVVAIAGLGAGLVSSIYCGIWVARRFAPPGLRRVLIALAAVTVIGVLNIFVAVAGCTAGLIFH